MIPSALKHVVGVCATALLLATAGCSFLSDDFDGLTVVNAMDDSFVFFGVDRELSHRMDPLSRIPVDAVAPDDGTFFLAPDESRVVREADIDGGVGPDQTLRLFLYEVRGDTAYAAGLRDVPYDDLDHRDFRVAIAAFHSH